MATDDNQNLTPAAVQNDTPTTEPGRQRINAQSWADKYAFPVIVALTVGAVGALATLFTQVVQMKEQISTLQGDHISAVALTNTINQTNQHVSELKTLADTLRLRSEGFNANVATLDTETKDISNHLEKAEHELAMLVEIRERLAVIETTLRFIHQGDDRKSATPAVSTAR
jgi:chromosome segregation ATPase